MISPGPAPRGLESSISISSGDGGGFAQERGQGQGGIQMSEGVVGMKGASEESEGVVGVEAVVKSNPKKGRDTIK